MSPTCTRRFALTLAMIVPLAGCGGGGDPQVQLAIDGAPVLVTSATQIVLSGLTFIPAGSSCPSSSEFIIIGTFGSATITTRNAATGAESTGFLQSPWVCNDGSDEVSWASNPITLAVGDNPITVTMRDSQRVSSATIVVTRSAS